ncbi:pancreatic lipase-related protein 2 isoform X2 [Chelonus insularis]|uniref:pancreatic lipase-related protein 2 isoform X2 n=1 Tax=Chelonus insularis TaxID=460826 RepID=UPI00158DB5D6|nr:pancreatic lipase-related protein 2 isoform X2 [Chelonus insularis]
MHNDGCDKKLRHAIKHDTEHEPKFVLFTRPDVNTTQDLFDNDTELNVNLTLNLPTKIIVHGWKSDIRLTPLVDMKNEYLLREECNVIFVDWEKLAAEECYLHAIWHTTYVGQRVAEVIRKLRDTGAEDIHVIGFSLGAHVAGIAGFLLRPYKIPRITGLDPAMPGFIFASNSEKLDSTDAEFVDVYHTNVLMQGKIERSGHVDFYMNGGVTQPGCHERSNCDHTRSAVYFAESINTEVGFWGWPCPNLWEFTIHACPPTTRLRILAGDNVDKSARNYYIVKTNAESPFATRDL